MRGASVFSVVVGIVFFVATILAYAIPEFICLMISLLALVALVCMVIFDLLVGIIEWRKHSRFWWAPSVFCAIIIYGFISGGWGAPSIGNAIADHNFETRIGEYSRIVSRFKNGAISCTQACNKEFDLINPSYLPRGTKALFIARCDTGPIVVAFGARTDIPLLHTGYFYRDYKDGDKCITDAMKPENKWPYVRHVQGNWYRFSNEPGL